MSSPIILASCWHAKKTKKSPWSPSALPLRKASCASSGSTDTGKGLGDAVESWNRTVNNKITQNCDELTVNNSN